jgi:hypothetical protein
MQSDVSFARLLQHGSISCVLNLFQLRKGILIHGDIQSLVQKYIVPIIVVLRRPISIEMKAYDRTSSQKPWVRDDVMSTEVFDSGKAVGFQDCPAVHLVFPSFEAQSIHWVFLALRISSFFCRRSFFSSFSVSLLDFLSFFSFLLCSPLDFFLLCFFSVR